MPKHSTWSYQIKERRSHENQVLRHGPEVRTLLRLKRELNDQYAIDHGVYWARAE